MNIFAATTTVSFKVEETCCYCLCKYTNERPQFTFVAKGVYIKYVEGGYRGGEGRALRIFHKKFCSPGDLNIHDLDLNISWLSNFLRKYFIASQIIFSFLFKTYL